MYNIAHLETYTETALGPVQSDEALFLFGLVRVLRPKVIVEIGFFNGDSAINFLKALPEDGILYSLDCSQSCVKRARQIQDSRFRFIFKKQQDFKPCDVDGRAIDMLFIDASHDCDLNLALFEKIKELLTEDAIVAVHDTGTWNKELIGGTLSLWEEHMNMIRKAEPRADLNDKEFVHQPDERRFVNYLKLLHPEFQQIHLHTLNALRHGLTLLQRYKDLHSGRDGLGSLLKRIVRKFVPTLSSFIIRKGLPY